MEQSDPNIGLKGKAPAIVLQGLCCVRHEAWPDCLDAGVLQPSYCWRAMTKRPIWKPMREKINRQGTKLIARRRREKPGRKRYRGVKKRLIEIEEREERLNLGLQSAGGTTDLWPAALMDPSWIDRIADDVFDAPPTLERLSDFLAQENHALFLAVERDSQLVVGQVRGVVHYQPDGARQLYLDNLGVTRARQRQGIGRALVERLMRWAAKTYAVELCWLGTEPENDDANAFYRALGFQSGDACIFERPLS